MTAAPGSGDVTLPEAASVIIQNFESCCLIAYQDSGKVWTIGWGHTGSVDAKPIAPGMSITQEKADQLFAQDAATLFSKVADRPLLEAAALASFGYNCGIGALEKVLAGQAHIEDFNHVKGVVMPGLTRRRRVEATLVLISQQMLKK